MRIILSFVKPYRTAIVIAFSLMLIELTVELFQPFLISKIIDDGIIAEDLNVVMRWGALLIGFSFLAFLAGVTNSFYSSHSSQSVGFAIRERMYEKVQSLSSSQFDRFSNSSLITRMTNDVSQVQNVLFMMLRIAMRAPLMVIGGVIASLLINVKLALVLVIGVPLLAILIGFIVSKTRPMFSAIQRQLDYVNSVMQENLVAMRIIKAFRRKQYETRRFIEASSSLRDRTIRALRTIELTMPAILLVMNIGIILILSFGNVQVTEGQTSVGDVVAIINYTMRITASLGMMSWIISSYARARASIERITEVLVEEDQLTDAAADESHVIEEGHIRFDRVSFTYPGTEAPVLQRISFSVDAGQTVAILGATGSGKSSLFRLLPRLYDVNEGSIMIDGIDVRQYKFDELRQQIGFVPQEVLLFTGTVSENIRWGKEDATMEEVIEAAERAQIHETIMNLPKQYDTLIGQRGVNLSGGQKQRLSIARALVRKPAILLLDDSTSALDTNTEAKLLAAIAETACTTLIITQKISTAAQADQVILLEEGMLLAHGHHDELLATSPLYQKIYESQYGKEGASIANTNH